MVTAPETKCLLMVRVNTCIGCEKPKSAGTRLRWQCIEVFYDGAARAVVVVSVAAAAAAV